MIGDRIRCLRERLGWSQAHLAEASGVSERTVQRVETRHSYSGETAMALAAALGVNVNDLTAPGSSAPGEHRPLWLAPSPRAAAASAFLLTLPGTAIILANTLDYAGFSATPMQLLWSTAHAAGLVPAYWYLWPIPLIVAPAAGLLLVLASLVQVRGRPEDRAVTITGLELRWHMGAAAILALCAATMVAPAANIVGDMIAHSAGIPLD